MQHPSVEAPVNVRVEFADGRLIPLECVYTGFEGGVHVWTATTPIGVSVADLASGRVKVRLDKLPARTAIQVAVAAS